jgi:GNAT superfamily N-acetyltransferase
MIVVLDMSDVTVVRNQGPSSQREAARIWAAATAHRDGRPAPAPVESALPIIERGLSPIGSTLHLAYVGTRAAGFAVVVAHDRGLEILYLGVDPGSWGAGVARRLLLDVTEYAVETSRSAVDLWVYDDNVRAVDVYRRAGWLATEDVRTHATSGRLERRYIRSTVAQVGEPGG